MKSRLGDKMRLDARYFLLWALTGLWKESGLRANSYEQKTKKRPETTRGFSKADTRDSPSQPGD